MGRHTRSTGVEFPGQLMLPMGYHYCLATMTDSAGTVIAMCTKMPHSARAGHRDELKRWIWS